MDKIFQRLIATNFAELPGLNVEALIPVPESLVNEILEVTLRGNKNITYCRLHIHSDNRIVADVTLLAVRKGHPPEAVQCLAAAGQTLFG